MVATVIVCYCVTHVVDKMQSSVSRGKQSHKNTSRKFASWFLSLNGGMAQAPLLLALKQVLGHSSNNFLVSSTKT